MCHQKLTEEIVSRAIQNYLEELDPGKTYFLESDIEEWINPSQELLNQHLKDIEKKIFLYLNRFTKTMLSAIERRNEMEKEIEICSFTKKCTTI